MYTVLDFSNDGSLLRFSFASPVEVQEWHHTAFAQPIVRWLEDTLVPLARDRPDELSAHDVARCVAELAEGEAVPITRVDWLALALLAVQRYRETAAKLASTDSPELQLDCTSSAALARILSDIYDQCAQAIDAKLRAMRAA